MRRNHGKGHSYLLDGAKVPGVTTLIKGGFPSPGLIKWAGETTADYAIDHWAELAALPIAARLKELYGARFAHRDGMAVRGTRVHSLAQRLVAGDEVPVPDELAGHVQSYVRFLDEWQVLPLLVEAAVASRRHHYAGTLDLIAELPTGQRWLFDIKTGKGVYSDAALQLAAYANAEVYLDEHGDEQPMPTVDALAIIHVRADGYDVYTVPHTAATFAAFQHVAWIARLREDVMDEWLSEAQPVPVGAA